MPSFTPSSSVQMTSSGFITSMSWPVWICPARTSPGPVAVSTMRFGPSPCIRSASCLTFSTMSVTSSRTPGMLLNSCSTPSICSAVTAAPCSEDNRMRRSALPRVMPKPRSSGSAMTVATRDGSPPGSTSIFSGLINDCQFFCNATLGLLGAGVVGARRAPGQTTGRARTPTSERGVAPHTPAACALRRDAACADGSHYAESESCRGWQ